MMKTKAYTRHLTEENPPRHDIMVEVDVDQYVNLNSGLALGLVGRRVAETVSANVDAIEEGRGHDT